MKKNITFFVQNNYVTKLTAPVAIYARKNEFNLIDISSHSNLNINDCGIDWSEHNKVIPYGSVQFVQKLMSSSLAKHVHYNNSFETYIWTEHFKHHSLNFDGMNIKKNEVSDFLKNNQYHIRPSIVDKAFPGSVFNLDNWAKLLEERNLEDNLDCWISPVKEILAEWRCWIIDGKVIQISQYRENNKMYLKNETNIEIFNIATSFLSIFIPHPCVVMDIALTNNGYKLIEFNPINSSGWYAANIDNILDNLVKYTQK